MLHGGFSRRIHARYGQTRKGHLFRHAFFARQLEDIDDVVSTCAYVDLNPGRYRKTPHTRATDWGGYAATLGLAHPRRFHSPGALLEMIDRNPRTARALYRQVVQELHARERHVSSPNNGA